MWEAVRTFSGVAPDEDLGLALTTVAPVSKREARVTVLSPMMAFHATHALTVASEWAL
jgi:hypothetical protein